MMETSAVVLCGGRGTRMAGITAKYKCKSLIPILGRPVLFYTLSWLRDLGLKEIFLCIDRKELKNQIQDIATSSEITNWRIFQDLGHGFMPILYTLKRRYPKRVVMLCGNQPIPGVLLKKFLSSRHQTLLGLYKKTSDNPAVILNTNKNCRILSIAEEKIRTLKKREFFLSRPYLVNSSFYKNGRSLENRTEMEFKKWLDMGNKVFGSYLELPYEIHYEDDIPLLEKYIQNNFYVKT